MTTFDHERLDVYQAAIDFVAAAEEILKHVPRGRAYLGDQLRRAAGSIPLNVAEGAGEFAAKEKARFYRIAKRSATECAAILDVCRRLKLLEESAVGGARDLLLRIVAMLIRMIQGCGGSGSGTHAGTGANTGTGTHAGTSTGRGTGANTRTGTGTHSGTSTGTGTPDEGDTENGVFPRKIRQGRRR